MANKFFHTHYTIYKSILYMNGITYDGGQIIPHT